jgi:hypothetical protein
MVVKKENSLMPQVAALSKDEKRFFADVSAILNKGRSKAYAAVNYTIALTYWELGKRIVEQEQHGKERANYGDFLIRKLSIYLGQNFDKGFSIANLKNIRQFYLTFQNDQKGYTLCSQLSWSHIRLIMRLDGQKVRHYYLVETQQQNWSVRILSQNVVSSWGGVRKLPLAFTEQGIAILSGLLNSDIAISVNIQIWFRLEQNDVQRKER